MADLTVIILTKNEEKNIEKCIRSLQDLPKRIVLIDSYSTDSTAELARSLGAEVVEHPFESHAAQFNWALENICLDTEWIMRLDADEELLPELVAELNERLSALPETVTGMILRRRVYFLGRWLKHGGKYPELLLRVFRRGHGRSEMRQMDEHLVVLDGECVTSKHDFLDNNQKSLEWWIAKHNWYSNKEVLDCLGQEDDGSVDGGASSGQARAKRVIKKHGYYKLPRFFRAHLYFIYRYYFRLGFLDGKEGKIYTFLQAYWYRFLVDAKLYECEKLGIAPDKQQDLKN
ncbi:MAG: glycosyltransferase family 2 protein [Clostridia bacterium]|nr:glycosyltransferase family 2 protein [Clostridia bacterium]MBQ8382272.1 glycosyltransferase family 2 protein [Clostridia bacterium]